MIDKTLDFTINPSIFEGLIKIQKELPDEATRSKNGDNSESYKQPAGMALLGAKDNEIDTVIPLKMSGGCWDAPNINGKDMYDGFMDLIKSERICLGMALVRHPTYRKDVHDSNEGIMPGDLRIQLRDLQKNFTDITKTAWIVLHNDYFRVYRPTKRGLTCKEVTVQQVFNKKDLTSPMVKTKLDRDKGLRKQKALELIAKRKAAVVAIRERKKREEEAKALRIVEEKKKEDLAKENARIKKAREERERKKIDTMNTKLKEAKDEIIDAGGGLVWMKQKNGQYILWETKR